MDIPRWRCWPIKHWEPGWKTMLTASLDHGARFACAGKKILTTRSPRSNFRSRKCHEREAGREVEQQEGEKSHIGGAKRKATSSTVFVSDQMNPPTSRAS